MRGRVILIQNRDDRAGAGVKDLAPFAHDLFPFEGSCVELLQQCANPLVHLGRGQHDDLVLVDAERDRRIGLSRERVSQQRRDTG